MPRQRMRTETSVSRTMSVGRESVDAAAVGDVDDDGDDEVVGKEGKAAAERGVDGREEREACSWAE